MPILKRYWNVDALDLPSASIPTKIAELLPGQAITVKHIGTAGQMIYIGPSKQITVRDSYHLGKGETFSISIDRNDEPNTKLEIWGLPQTAGDDVCFIKVMGKGPDAEGS